MAMEMEIMAGEGRKEDDKFNGRERSSVAVGMGLLTTNIYKWKGEEGLRVMWTNIV